MNIFVLSEDPQEAAIMQCDQHVVKMPLESAQMLCAAFPIAVEAPYRRTHERHPCTLWTKTSSGNYEWLLLHALALCEEFEFRFQKIHASKEVVFWCFAHAYLIDFPQKEMTPFALAMNDVFINKNSVVESYRNFYLKDKIRFAKWTKGREKPSWMTGESFQLTSLDKKVEDS